MIKKTTFLLLLGLTFVACESSSVEDATFNEENETKPEVIDVIVDESHGLGN